MIINSWTLTTKFHEDIDLLVFSTQPFDTFTTTIECSAHDFTVDANNSRGMLKDTISGLNYDIKILSTRGNPRNYLDNIQLSWDVERKIWLCNPLLSTSQNKFLWSKEILTTDDDPAICSIFWALHLYIKEHAMCRSDITTSSLLAKSILKNLKKNNISNTLFDILHAFSGTVYWQAALRLLLTILSKHMILVF